MEFKPGTIYGSDPVIIYVRMLCCVEVFFKRDSRLDLFHSLQVKFNDALNTSTARYDARIMTIATCNTNTHFNHKGELSVKGQCAFWYEVDDLLERFDHNEVKLLPNTRQSTNKHPETNMDITSDISL